MTIRFRRRLLFVIAGVIGLSCLIPVGFNVLLKGNWSLLQIAVCVAAMLVTAGSAYFYLRVTGDYEVQLGNLMVSCCALVFALILVEVLARVYLMNLASPSVFNQFASVNQLVKQYGEDYIQDGWVAPHRYIGYIPTPKQDDGENKHNSLGFRGDEIQQPKPDGIYRIACLGGSTTYSAVWDYTQSYPYMLQGYLNEAGYENVEVINAGVWGYMSWESLSNLEYRVLDLEPDLVIIYHAINDVFPRFVWPPDVYRGDNSGARVVRLQPVQMPPIWEYSTALRMGAIALNISQPHSALDWQFDEYPPTAYGDLFLDQKRMGTYPAGIFDDIPAETMLQENPPIYFERNLMNMVAIAQIHDIDVVFLTFAISPSSNPLTGSEEWRMGIEEGNQVVSKVAVETGAFLYDFAADMPTGRQYFDGDGHHFTVLGNKKRVSLIGEYLIELGILEIEGN